jgi:lysophospholipase L1-like esterase
MARKNVVFVFYIVAVTVGSLLAVEYICLRLNSASGVQLPFAVTSSTIPLVRGGKRYNVIDPHLGYAHGVDEYKVQKIIKQYSWVNGFVVYNHRPTELKRPTILALGGSTTDGVNYGHSWPEELANLLARRGISATVINGGTGGYTSNQDLLKLVRDGLEFRPDIIIDYGGVNDRGDYGELPYPMVHLYQRQILEYLTGSAVSPLLPNTVAWLRRVFFAGKSRISYTLGVKSSLTQAQQYERNVVLMEAIARTQGAAFFAIVQPHAYFRNKHPENFKVPHSSLVALYGQIIELPKRLPFVYDLTRIFEDREKDVYKKDGIHLQQNGDQIVAENIMTLILPELTKRASEEPPIAPTPNMALPGH